MIKGVGNKKAAKQSRKKNKYGVYASIDANDFHEINNRYGHDHGDEAIKALGGALRDALQKINRILLKRTKLQGLLRKISFIQLQNKGFMLQVEYLIWVIRCILVQKVLSLSCNLIVIVLE